MNQHMMNPDMVAKARKDGTWSVNNDKVRITYKDSEESVLFEDTASISYIKCKKPNPGIIGLGVLVTILIIVFSNDIDVLMWSWVPAAIGGVFAAMSPIKFDNVAIETRGGKIIRFSVPADTGQQIMDQIEGEKRKWEEKQLSTVDMYAFKDLSLPRPYFKPKILYPFLVLELVCM